MLLPHVSSANKRNVNISAYRVKWDGPCKSNFQFNVKQFFKTYWEGDDCYEELPVVGTRLTCDLVNFSRRYAVESDGNFHNTFSSFHHKTRMGLLHSKKRDQLKDAWLSSMGIYVIRISQKEFNKLSFEWLKEKFEIDILEKFE